MNAYFFKPIFQERIWGNQKLKELFGRAVPEGKKIGESWELVDRPEACSEIESGPGIAPGTRQNLHTLWQDKRTEVFGTKAPDLARFPILIKLLDCQDNLSVQVHPPQGTKDGEPKTEMWYFLETTPEAKIYVGLKKGVTRDKFEKAIGTPELAGLLGTVKSIVAGSEREAGRTTPEAIDLQRTFREMLDGGDAACVMEVSSHAL